LSFLIGIGAFTGGYAIASGLNTGSSWSWFYKAPKVTVTTTLGFEAPSFTNAVNGTVLQPQSFWTGVYALKNATATSPAAWTTSPIWEGAATGVTAGILIPTTAGVVYTEFAMFYAASPALNMAGVAAGYYPMREVQLFATGWNNESCYAKPLVASFVTNQYSINSTVATIAAGTPLKAKNAAASNLTIDVLMSQAFTDRFAEVAPYPDLVNNTNNGIYFGCTINGTAGIATDTTYLKVYINGNLVAPITPTPQGDTTVVYYEYTGTLTPSAPVVASIYWTAAAVTANAGMNAAPKVYYGSGLAPGAAWPAGNTF